jgi:general secretion pathway protein M
MNTDFKTRALDQYAEWKNRFDALQPRERWIIVAGALLVLLVAIYTLALSPLYTAVNARGARIMQKQQDLAYMQSIAPQLSALNSAQPSASSSGESMVVLIANSASSSNVSAALTGQTPDGPDGVRVRFEGVAFDALITWLGALQKDYGIRIKDAEITRMAQLGQVNATLALSRSGG